MAKLRRVNGWGLSAWRPDDGQQIAIPLNNGIRGLTRCAGGCNHPLRLYASGNEQQRKYSSNHAWIDSPSQVQ